MLVVKTKADLKKAQKDKVKEFLIVGDLAEKVQKAKGISKLSKKKVMVLSGILAASVAAAIPTGGASLGAPVFFAAAEAGAAGAAGAGLSTGAIIAIASIGGALVAYALYKDYSLEFEKNPNGGTKVKCTRH